MPPEDVGELPDGHLLLEHVYGYTGCAHANIGLAASGEIVYPAAGLAVVAAVRGEAASQRFFAGHTAAVSCLAMHPSLAVCATAQGGLSPYVCVWDVGTSQPLATLRGVHTRAVRALAFSADGRWLASLGADGSHALALYDWAE